MSVTPSSKEFVYYDDPNELCDRLDLLVREKIAGNGNVINEIQNIVEELVELDIIYPPRSLIPLVV